MGEASQIMASAILFIGVLEDLRSRKVRNKIILFMAGFSLLIIALVDPTLFKNLQSTLIVFAMGFPLFLLNILGAGDIKLLMVFSLFVDWKLAVATFVISLFWGGLLGLFKAALDKRLFPLLQNFYRMIVFRSVKEKIELHYIPYTVALLLGWASTWTLLSLGVSLW